MQTNRVKEVFLAAGVGVTLLAACASPPMALDRARGVYQEASSEEKIAKNASVELYEAEKTLSKAEAAWDLRRDSEEAQHLAYVTERRVEIARVAADRKAAEAETNRLGQERERVLLTARTREAESERLRAEQRTQEAEEARREAEARAREAQAAREAADAAARKAAELEQALKELGARETQRGLVLTIGDVLFDLNQAELKPGAVRNLYKLVSFLKENSDRQVLIEGHTDSSGADSYNLQLSDRRAASVRQFLVENGIPTTRISSKGYGEAYPIASNETQAGRQQNRRVEVVILRQGESLESHIR